MPRKSRTPKMTPQEAGRLGGRATAARHDRSFYERIGRQGGMASSGSFDHNPERAARAGRKGGRRRGSRR